LPHGPDRTDAMSGRNWQIVHFHRSAMPQIGVEPPCATNGVEWCRHIAIRRGHEHAAAKNLAR
jgi:hypothetical protein